jgi:hypothetical protein
MARSRAAAPPISRQLPGAQEQALDDYRSSPVVLDAVDMLFGWLASEPGAGCGGARLDAGRGAIQALALAWRAEYADQSCCAGRRRPRRQPETGMAASPGPPQSSIDPRAPKPIPGFLSALLSPGARERRGGNPLTDSRR